MDANAVEETVLTFLRVFPYIRVSFEIVMGWNSQITRNL